MAANATKKRNPTDTPPAEDSSSSATWRPQVETDREFNPFANTVVPGEESDQISHSAPEPMPVEQSSAATATRGATRRRQPGSQGRRSVRKAKGVKKKATSSRAKTTAKTRGKAKTKAKAKAKARARGKGNATARGRRAKAGRRTRARSGKRR